MAFVEITPAAYQAMRRRQYPLGFETMEAWTSCVTDLVRALKEDGLSDADVRLQGSAAHFYSRNPEKVFPRSEEGLVLQAAVVGVDETRAREAWRKSPYAVVPAGQLPERHFFDSRFKFELDGPSDYDVQLCSSSMAQEMQRVFPEGTFGSARRPIVSDHGGHFRHDALAECFPALGAWADRWSDLIGRSFNLAGFAADGPIGDAAFDDNDWRIT